MTAWLVEMIHNDAPTPRWWNPNKGWVWDANEATRFCRKQDAEDAIAGDKWLQGRATEHVFLHPKARGEA